MSLSTTEIALLASIVAATNTGPEAFAYVTPEEVINLRTQGLVQTNPQIMEVGSTRIAGRATPQGIDANTSFAAQAGAGTSWNPAPAAAPAPEAPVAPPAAPAVPAATSFVVMEGGALPKVVRVAPKNPRAGHSIYPFETMENIGSIFFVPVSDKMPNPQQTMQSAVTAANKRFLHMEPRRRFKVARIMKGQVAGSFVAPADGAVVMRVDPSTFIARPKKKTVAVVEAPLPLSPSASDTPAV